MVAICALFLTVYQAYLSRRYNRISVAPKLSSFASRDSDQGLGEIHIKLCNNGLGPALIENFKFVLDDDDLCFEDSSEALDFLTDLVGIIQTRCAITTLTRDTILKTGEEVSIIHVTFLEDEGRGWAHIESLVDRLAINVKYQSMYGEQFEYSNIRNLDNG